MAVRFVKQKTSATLHVRWPGCFAKIVVRVTLLCPYRGAVVDIVIMIINVIVIIVVILVIDWLCFHIIGSRPCTTCWDGISECTCTMSQSSTSILWLIMSLQKLSNMPCIAPRQKTVVMQVVPQSMGAISNTSTEWQAVARHPQRVTRSTLCMLRISLDSIALQSS